MTDMSQAESKPVKMRWRTLKADMRSPFERRQELHVGSAYIGVVEPSVDGTYLARGQSGGPHESFSSLDLAKACLEDYATRRKR